ncbi:chloride channel protein [Puia sp. P3]|uniref:chloride channel protein n=1 Tax=Puia sp. P3 TaxID=3423952 RepID=UPI003D66EC74
MGGATGPVESGEAVVGRRDGASCGHGRIVRCIPYSLYYECADGRIRGSAGLESPIVATGSSLGSTMAKLGLLSYSGRTLMIACGAAAGISAVYGAPVAGVMFAVEVLLAETVLSYFVPLIIAAVIGALCSKVFFGESRMFDFCAE